jgi:DNA-binding response OmpR family regulator
MKNFDFENINILVFEDDYNIIELYKTYLKHTKSNVMFYDLNKKEDIISFIRENNIHIVLMDIMLGELNGFDLIKQIKKELNIPVISVTNLSKEKDIIRSLKSGADQHINKPIKKEILLNGINLYLKPS